MFKKSFFAQAKLVTVLQGSILDVAVDLRKSSSNFGKCFKYQLTDTNYGLLYIPEGFAHGFLAFEPNTIVQYAVNNLYNPSTESGIVYNDPTLAIKWHYFDAKNLIFLKKI
ncbi:MAG: dTDP-4-keto-6-deoxy-D-glucose epimerase [Thermales bacterium]|nr:dTDP-4-keto-6-deoxy-D-glucose epimerase [Thermales bacterium]